MIDLSFAAFEVALFENDEVHVALGGGEMLTSGGATVVHDRRVGLLQRFGLAPHAMALKPGAVVVEFGFRLPDGTDEVEPFGGVDIAFIVLAPGGTKHLKFVLVPAADEVESKATAGDMVDGGALFGGRHRVYEGHMTVTEHTAVGGEGADGCRPSEGFEGAMVEVGSAAIAFPAGYEEKDFEAGAVGLLDDVDGVGPGHMPGAGGSGDGRTVAAVEGHDIEFHAIVIEQGVALGCGVHGVWSWRVLRERLALTTILLARGSSQLLFSVGYPLLLRGAFR